jgi:hypothetical protein
LRVGGDVRWEDFWIKITGILMVNLKRIHYQVVRYLPTTRYQVVKYTVFDLPVASS